MVDFRIGIGYDIHRLAEGRKLILAGVEVPHTQGLQGHSDADVVCHALCDALLGAAAFGDIGTHFPDTDERYAGSYSVKLLCDVLELVKNAGYEVSNVDVTIHAERPKLQSYISEMRRVLAEALQIPIDRVSLKAKTNEKMDAIGRCEAIAATAVALIYKS
ncbi:MAG: 2-C-methyl-D-erythritol 2,4-cyclodiphosphate synthase [Acidobacteriota bacterium]|nr:2-C-methyl-D-erythritol 2,4-cyclodiphosphate synthase [Blastocatellia bacterium]MDW8412302.1 2-C-methyl-D-erythritol 2,4-cyclodiphosphate synthase [Acidobacteriota bacterium]